MSDPIRTDDASDTSASAADATVLGTRAGQGEADRGAGSAEIARGSEVGRYIVLHALGRGASGRVWVAYDADLDRRVALKVLDAVVGEDPERRRRQLLEAQAMAKVRHPNVVTVFDVGSHADRLYIAMELVEGTTLGAWCRAAPRSVSTILTAFTAAARGLAAAHAAGVVHRDFKPENVLVEGDPAHAAVKVADFGLARAATPGPGAVGTGDGTGTPAYMSPEHHGHGVVDARSDQFSFCVALFEALWGHRPFRGVTLGELAAATCSGAIDDAGGAGVPSRLRPVVLRGLAVAPAQRHASMDALITALDRAGRSRWPAAAALVAGTALVGVAWWRLGTTPRVDECTRGAEIVAAVWGPEQRARVSVAPGAYAPTFVAASEQRVRDALDEYARGWAHLHDEVCAEDRREQTASGPGTSARECVEDRRASLAALAEVLSTRALEVTSVDAVLADLPVLSVCRHATHDTFVPVPTEQALRGPVLALRDELRGVSMRRRVGAGDDAVARLEAMREQAAALDYPHLLASIEAELGIAHLDQGRAQQALALLDDALERSLAAGHDRLAAGIIASILLTVARAPSLAVDTERMARIANALLARGSHDDGILGLIALQLGSVRYDRGDPRGSVEQYRIATEAWGRAYGPRHPQVARAILGQALAMLRLEDIDEADRLVTAVLPDLESGFGPSHALMLDALSVRAGVADQRGDWQRALELMTDALQRARAVAGDRRTNVSSIAYNLAGVAAVHGRTALAREHLALSRRAWPYEPDSVTEGEFSQLEALISLASGEYELAIQHADATIAQLSVGGGARAMRVASAKLIAAHALLGLRRYVEVLAAIEGIGTDAGYEQRTAARMGVIAATAIGDPLAAARWLAIGASAPRNRRFDAEGGTFMHVVVFPRPNAAQLAAGRSARDAYAADTFPGDPILAVMDAWLAGRWPPSATSPLGPVPVAAGP